MEKILLLNSPILQLFPPKNSLTVSKNRCCHQIRITECPCTLPSNSRRSADAAPLPLPLQIQPPLRRQLWTRLPVLKGGLQIWRSTTIPANPTTASLTTPMNLPGQSNLFNWFLLFSTFECSYCKRVFLKMSTFCRVECVDVWLQIGSSKDATRFTLIHARLLFATNFTSWYRNMKCL